MVTIKIADMETLWSELSDKDAEVVSGGMCRGGGYSTYDPELSYRVCLDYGIDYNYADIEIFSIPGM